MEQEEVQYILGNEEFDGQDFNQETLVLDETQYQNLLQQQNGSRAILLKNNRTLILQRPELLQEFNTDTNEVDHENDNVIHFLHEDEFGEQIIYKLEDGHTTELVQNEEELKFEPIFTNIVNNMEMIHSDDPQIETNTHINNTLKQFAILRDGKLYLKSDSGEEVQIVTDTPVEAVNNDDRNDPEKLICDDLVTNDLTENEMLPSHLDNSNEFYVVKNRIYRERRKKKINQKTQVKNVNENINKKRLIGKIIDIRKGDEFLENTDTNTKTSIYKFSLNIERSEDETAANVIKNESGNDDVESLFIDGNGKILKVMKLEKAIDECYNLNKEDIDFVSKTLSGLMLMTSLQKKLLFKTLYVKVVEKHFNGTIEKYSKILGYIKGFLNKEPGNLFKFNELTEDVDYGVKNEIEKCKKKYNAPTLLMFEESVTIHKVVNILGLVSTKVIVLKNSKANKRKPKRPKEDYQQAILTDNYCEICSLHFSSQEEMEQHQNCHYSISAIVVPENNQEEENVDALNTVELDNVTLKVEKIIDGGDAEYTDTTIEMAQQIFHCKSCDKSYTNMKDLNAHFVTHNSIKTYVCDVCSREFTRYANLIRHLEVHRGNGKKYICHFCGCAYNYNASLTRHLVHNHLQ